MINFQDLPASHGTYVLHLFVSHAQPIEVGRLGLQHLPIGDYFYIGSARGAGGLRARVGRHLRGDGAPHGTSTTCAPSPKCEMCSTR